MVFGWVRFKLIFLSVPLLAGIYPAIFHYGNNAHLVLFSNFLETSFLLIGISLAIYLIFYLVTQGSNYQAAIGTTIFLLFFYLYGLVYDTLRHLDIIQIETYSFLPFYLVLAAYCTLSFPKNFTSSSERIVKVTALILALLILLNIIKVIPAEVRKIRTVGAQQNPLVIQPESENYPDIYYLVFDEAAGFNAIRQYWRDDSVDEYVDFLLSKGFFIAEKSHSKSIRTLCEISTRLNFQQYPEGDEYFDGYYEAIANNRVMSYLKGLGYTLIAYDQRRDAFPTSSPLPVDLLIEESPDDVLSSIIWLDEYKMLVLGNTLLRPFLNNLPQYMASHRNMIFHTVENVASSQLPSPKFVYVHLLFPHAPFMFNENGEIVVGLSEQYNWQRYLGTYKYFLVLSKKMVEDIFAASESDHPPVIIIQSDHGARNIKSSPFSGNLENFPNEFVTLIVNAMHLPGCEDAPLTQDMDPINTFPIIFNCYFDAKIPLQ